MIGLILGGWLAGLALGMLGAGGTIIGLPLILYLGGPQGHAAFGTNALGVALTSLLLLVWRIARREIALAAGAAFTVPGLAGIAIGTQLGLLYSAAKLIFLLSFLILVVAAWIFYLSTRPAEPTAPRGRLTRRHVARIVPTALVVGLISGFFAIGGGFLVVPGLAIAAEMDLRTAGRASLLPITAFAALDAAAYVLAGDVVVGDSLLMLGAGIVGGIIGLVLGNRLPLRVIQRAFAVFLALIAAYMIAQHV